MTKQVVDIGSIALNGADGDTAREAFTKVNANFTEVYDGLQGQSQSVNNKVDKVVGKSLVDDTEIVKLLSVEANATQNSADSYLLDRANHTGTQAIGSVFGLQAELDDKEEKLVQGAGIIIDRTNPDAPVISAAGGAGLGDVVGPASSVNGEIAVFSGNTGKVINGGGVLGTAAFTASNDYATAAQGVKADAAVQASDLGTAAFTNSDQYATSNQFDQLGVLLVDNDPTKGSGALPYNALLEYPAGSIGQAVKLSGGGLRDDLLDPEKGAKLVGFRQLTTGAVARLVSSKLQEQLSIFDFMTEAQIADVTQRGLTLDVTTAFQAAADVGGTIKVPAGSYLVGNIIGTKPVRFVGDGRAVGSANAPTDGTTAIYQVHTSGVGITLNASYSGVSNMLIRRITNNVVDDLTAIQTNAPIMCFDELRLVHNKIGIHGALNHFYVDYKHVWHSGSKHLVDASDNNAVLYDSCQWSGQFEIHNAFSLTMINPDFSEGGDVSLLSPYKFIDPVSVVIQNPYAETSLVSPLRNWVKFSVTPSGVLAGLGRSVSIIGGYFRGVTGSTDTAYSFDGAIDTNIYGGYYRNLNYVIETLNGARAVAVPPPTLTSVTGLFKNANSASSGTVSYASTQIRFGSQTETPSASAVTGAVFKNTGTDVNMDAVLAPSSPIHITRKSSQGTGGGVPVEEHYRLMAGGAVAGSLGVNRDTRLLITGASYVELQGGTSRVAITTGCFIPSTDNNISLGIAGQRWSTVFAGTGTISTSDIRYKQQIRDITEAELAVATKLKGMIKAFKFNDSVESKGDGARIHFGVMAQEVKATFESEGLVAEDYALLCYDEWDDEIDEDGVLITPAGNRYGVRYDQLLAFIISTL